MLLLGKHEGIITYDVTFPFEENSLMLELFPKEMTLEFKKEQMRTSVKSSYGVITTDFIIDNKSHTLTQLLKSFGEKSSLTIANEGVSEWLSQYPPVRLEFTNESDSVAGYLCHKTIAHFENDSIPPITILYTKDIKLDHSNWWNQFQGIDGFLMGYEIEQFGKRMRLRAREIKFEPIQDERFVAPTDYKQVDNAAMHAQMQKLVDDFVN